MVAEGLHICGVLLLFRCVDRRQEESTPVARTRASIFYLASQAIAGTYKCTTATTSTLRTSACQSLPYHCDDTVVDLEVFGLSMQQSVYSINRKSSGGHQHRENLKNYSRTCTSHANSMSVACGLWPSNRRLLSIVLSISGGSRSVVLYCSSCP